MVFDMVCNEFMLYIELLEWLIELLDKYDVDFLNEWVYDELFLIFLFDLWIGLVFDDVYLVFENDGIYEFFDG